MTSFSPKLEIINHFDESVNQVDIHFEEQFEKYKESQVLGDLNHLVVSNELEINNYYFNPVWIEFFDWYKPSKNKQQTDYIWSESTRIVDYLNQIRMKKIEEFRKAQEDCLEHYKSNSDQFKTLFQQSDISIDEKRSIFFGHKFYFQVTFQPLNYDIHHKNLWPFNLYTIVTDFYLSQTDIVLLEKFINCNDRLTKGLILNEKTVFFALIRQSLYENFYREIYPNHVICVNKHDIWKVRAINLRSEVASVNLTGELIDLSRLEELSLNRFKEIRLNGLCSLKKLSMNLFSIDRCSFEDLFSLKELTVNFILGKIPEMKKTTNLMHRLMIEQLFEQCQNIEKIHLCGDFYGDFNMASLVNLKNLTLNANSYVNFNFSDLFKNVCSHLEFCNFRGSNINNEDMAKVFYEHHFPNLLSLYLYASKITKLEKRLFEGFSRLEELSVTLNNDLSVIEPFSFSNLKKLKKLYLRCNKFSQLYAESFIGLDNLEELDLSENKLEYFDPRILDHIPKVKRIYLCGNSIKNKDDLDRFRDSKIEFKF